MKAVDAVRVLMLDGRPRKPREIIEATRLGEWPVRGALRRLCHDYTNPLLLQLPAPPSRSTRHWGLRGRRGGSFYLLNPNSRDALTRDL